MAWHSIESWLSICGQWVINKHSTPRYSSISFCLLVYLLHLKSQVKTTRGNWCCHGVIFVRWRDEVSLKKKMTSRRVMGIFTVLYASSCFSFLKILGWHVGRRRLKLEINKATHRWLFDIKLQCYVESVLRSRGTALRTNVETLKRKVNWITKIGRCAWLFDTFYETKKTEEMKL